MGLLCTLAQSNIMTKRCNYCISNISLMKETTNISYTFFQAFLENWCIYLCIQCIVMAKLNFPTEDDVTPRYRKNTFCDIQIPLFYYSNSESVSYHLIRKNGLAQNTELFRCCICVHLYFMLTTME